MTPINQTRGKNFGPRFLATWLDCLLICMALKVFRYLLFSAGLFIYFPFQFSFFLTGMAYSAVSVALTGQTIGKYLLNIRVCSDTGQRLPLLKSLLRESLYKLISGIFLGLGFLQIGFSKNKKGWHDRLASSVVTNQAKPLVFGWLWKITAIASFMILGGGYLWTIASAVYVQKRVNAGISPFSLPFVHRNPAAVTDVGTIKNRLPFTSWISQHAEDARSYALRMAREHQVVLFGETHDNRDNLVFFNSIINDLYYKAGVRCIGMEVIPAYMNEKVSELTTEGKGYDRNLALEIARSQVWKAWGDKEYWDVLETVWKLNAGLPDSSKMRVIGLDDKWDISNIVLLNLGGDRKGPTPFYEKFRAPSAITDIIRASGRDVFMFNEIEKEILKKNQKGVIWIGAAHCYPCFGYPVVRNNKIIMVNRRMGSLLHEKYPGGVFHILMNNALLHKPAASDCPQDVTSLLESAMAADGNAPAGFSIKGSPFEVIRDNCSNPFDSYPTVCLGDLAQGIVFLKPFNKLKHCSWTAGYINDRMFMEYKPLYEQMTQKHLNTAGQANQYFKNKLN